MNKKTNIDREVEEILERMMYQMMNEKLYKPNNNEVKLIYEITDSDFEDMVIKKSRERPVVVDFWAPWCGPCYILSPIIEKVVDSLNGKVLLMKINVDENPYVANKYRITSIPTVILFKNGEAVDYFIGALPEEMIMQWLRKNMISP